MILRCDNVGTQIFRHYFPYAQYVASPSTPKYVKLNNTLISYRCSTFINYYVYSLFWKT